MEKIIQELEFKFNMEAGIRDKTAKINNSFSDQEFKLDEAFNIGNVEKKYSNRFYDQREILLKQLF